MTMPENAGTRRISARELAIALGRWPASGPLGYRLLAAFIGRLADSGELPPGTLLPGERALAAALSVSRGMVTRAYQALRDDGRARTRHGRGTSLTRHRPSPGTMPRANPPGAASPAADLATAAPGCAPQVAAALRNPGSLPALAERQAATDTHGYFPLGWPTLRESIAGMLTAWHGIPTSPGQVLITTGAQQALDLLIRCQVLPGRTAVTESPTYPGALCALRRAGARPLGVPPGDIPRLARALASGPALAYLVPTHQNPTGLVLPAEERHQIVDLARRHQEVTFVDDLTLADLPLASDWYADGPQPPPLAALAPRMPNVVTVGSFSKLYWGGLRTGWIRAPEGMIARLAAAKATADMGGTAYQQPIVAALADHYHEDILKWRADWLRSRYEALTAALRVHLPSWRWRTPHGGLTIWAELPHGLCGPDGRFPDADAFAHAALDSGVAVTPGSALTVSGSSPRHVRLSFTLSPGDLTAAVRVLAAV